MSSAISQFEELFRSNYKSLCGVANGILRNKDAAKDIVQEVFEKFWKRHEELLLIENKKGYLFRATTNACINYLESNKNIVRFDDVNINLSVNPNENMTIHQLEKEIQAALAKLPPKCKAIFVLSRFEEMKYKEIAEHLDISIKTVENQMGIALQRMRDELKPYITKEFLGLVISSGIVYIIPYLSFQLLLALV